MGIDIGVLFLLVGLVSGLNWLFFYFIIKSAVKNGTIQAIIEAKAAIESDDKLVRSYRELMEMEDEDG